MLHSGFSSCSSPFPFNPLCPMGGQMAFGAVHERKMCEGRAATGSLLVHGQVGHADATAWVAGTAGCRSRRASALGLERQCACCVLQLDHSGTVCFKFMAPMRSASNTHSHALRFKCTAPMRRASNARLPCAVLQMHGSHAPCFKYTAPMRRASNTQLPCAVLQIHGSHAPCFKYTAPMRRASNTHSHAPCFKHTLPCAVLHACAAQNWQGTRNASTGVNSPLG